MAKLTLVDLASLTNEIAAMNSINTNSDLIETAMEKTLSRDGTTPNQMGADLDMNSNDILNVHGLDMTQHKITNLAAGSATGNAVNWDQLNAAVVHGGNLPLGGTENQILAKNSSASFDAKWIDNPTAVVNVKSFSNTGNSAVCSGDDSIDDSVAINAAVAFVQSIGGGQVVYPAGTDCRIKHPINAVTGVHHVGQGGINQVPNETSIIRPSANLSAMFLQPDLPNVISDFGLIGMTLEGRKGTYTVSNLVRVAGINSHIRNSVIRNGSGNCVQWDRSNTVSWVNFFMENEIGDCDGFNFSFSGSDSWFIGNEFGGGGQGSLLLTSSGGNTITGNRIETSDAGGGGIILETPTTGDPNCLGGNNTLANTITGNVIEQNNYGIYYKKGTCSGNVNLGDIVSGNTFIGNTVRDINVEAGITNGHIGPNSHSTSTPSASYLGFIPGTNNTGWTFEGTVGSSTLTENTPTDLTLDITGAQQSFKRGTGTFRTSATIGAGSAITSSGPGGVLTSSAFTSNASANTVSTLVARDSSGNFSAGTITAALTGLASTATALANARTIGGVSFDGTTNITVSTATSGFTVSGGDLALGTNNITMTGSIGTTGSRLTKGWFTDLQVTNAIAGSITGNAATVTTNANLTGPITSSGNATSIASQTGTGSTFAMSVSPTFTGTVSAANLTLTGLTDISGASAGQIKFPATQNASANVNTFDDYEEGTFTPAITFATPGDLAVAYTEQAGFYTKKGREVTAIIRIATTAGFTWTTASGAVTITGLPFTSANITSNRSVGMFTGAGINKASFTSVQARVDENSTVVQMIAFGMGQNSTAVAAADMTSGVAITWTIAVTYNTAT